jgi:hypothetical protein
MIQLKKLSLIALIFVIAGCTHYAAIPYDQLSEKGLIGHWEMSLDSYFIDIFCEGTLAFNKPSSNIFYGDQKGSGFVITELKENQMITGPVLRVPFEITEWPHEENNQTYMTFEGRIWHKAKNFNCQ